VTWAGVLDALEADARRLEAAAGDPVAVELLLGEGVGAVPPSAGQLGPLPRHLADRARTVLDRLGAARAALAEGREAVAAAILRSAPPPERPTARFIDRVV
jgi:hypothetical protein